MMRTKEESTYYRQDLKDQQRAGLGYHIQTAQLRICEALDYACGNVYVSFSGGKDSAVLLDLVAQVVSGNGILKPHQPPESLLPLHVVFADTGLEYPEIRQFSKDYVEYIAEKYSIPIVREVVYPSYKGKRISFTDVITRYGYPVISKEVSQIVGEARNSFINGRSKTVQLKRLMGEKTASSYDFTKYEPLLYVDFDISHVCCDRMKKGPFKAYEKRKGRMPITGVMAEESSLRTSEWIKHGCNALETNRPQSKPMSIWTNQTVLEYISKKHLPMAPVYGEIILVDDPGQVELEGFEGCGKLKCSGCQRTGCIFCGFGAHLEKPGEGRFERLRVTHPRQYAYCIGGGGYSDDGLWRPTKEGLGLGHVFDSLNGIYGKDFIKY